jgi:hypothetical protein
MGLKPGKIPVPSGGVHDEAVALGAAIGNEIVDHAAGLIEQSAVAGLPGGEGRHILGQQTLKVGRSVRARNIDHGHVGDVENATAASHRVVLLELRAIVEGHFPPKEGNHLGA